MTSCNYGPSGSFPACFLIPTPAGKPNSALALNNLLVSPSTASPFRSTAATILACSRPQVSLLCFTHSPTTWLLLPYHLTPAALVHSISIDLTAVSSN